MNLLRFMEQLPTESRGTDLGNVREKQGGCVSRTGTKNNSTSQGEGRMAITTGRPLQSHKMNENGRQ
jgi:hypothetical protein